MAGDGLETLFEAEGAERFTNEDEFIKNIGCELAYPLVDLYSSETELDNAGSDENFFAWQFGKIVDQSGKTFFVTRESVIN